MGFGGISIWQLLIILVIIVLLFGTKRLRNIGTDLGSAIRGFRSSIKDQDANSEAEDATFTAEPRRDAVTAQPTTTTAQAVATPAPSTTEAKQAAASQPSGQDKN
jgi:sec-independent protein translocase protein TatA